MRQVPSAGHAAISIYTNGIAAERHLPARASQWQAGWMPKRSDCPYPEGVCSQIHDATTLERYQNIKGRGDLCLRGPLPKNKKAGGMVSGLPPAWVLMVYFLLTHTPFTPWADLSRIQIIIVVNKCAHLRLPYDFHIICMSFFSIRKCHVFPLVSSKKSAPSFPLGA